MSTLNNIEGKVIHEAQARFITYASSLQKEINDLREELQDELNRQTLFSSRVATLVIQEITSPGSLKIHLEQNARLLKDIEQAMAFVSSLPQEDGSVHDEDQVQTHEQVPR